VKATRGRLQAKQQPRAPGSNHVELQPRSMAETGHLAIEKQNAARLEHICWASKFPKVGISDRCIKGTQLARHPSPTAHCVKVSEEVSPWQATTGALSDKRPAGAVLAAR